MPDESYDEIRNFARKKAREFQSKNIGFRNRLGKCIRMISISKNLVERSLFEKIISIQELFFDRR